MSAAGRLAALLAASVLVALAIFQAGRWSAGVAPARRAGRPVTEPAGARAVSGPPIGAAPRWPAALPPAPMATCDAPDPETIRQGRLDRASYLLDRVFQQLEMQALGGVAQVEDRARYALPYLRGVIDGAMQADPGIRQAFSSQFTSALCERQLKPDQTITMANLALLLPDAATPQGFDCFFSHAREDLPLWSMLDAWRESGFEKTPVLARLQASATDERTTTRFLKRSDLALERFGKHEADLVRANERMETP